MNNSNNNNSHSINNNNNSNSSRSNINKNYNKNKFLLEHFPKHLQAALPLKLGHKQKLAENIAGLSLLLTGERGQKLHHKPYWLEARYLSAYLWYFLPWNLLRLSVLLPGLTLELKDKARILDLGSGTLTFPVALWLVRPDLRQKPLTFVCVDSSLKPLETGHKLFLSLTQGKSPWQIILKRQDLLQSLKENRGAICKTFDLIVLANVVNELKVNREQPFSLHLTKLCQAVKNALQPEGSFLLIEPGNRLGGKIISEFRNSACAASLKIHAPCLHKALCPLFESYCQTWCHFSLSFENSPEWLDKLSIKAGLPKNNLSLSYLFGRKVPFLSSGKSDQDSLEQLKEAGKSKPDRVKSMQQHRDMAVSAASVGQKVQARVVSNAFRVDLAKGLCRYACSVYGLLLLENAENFVSGAVVDFIWPEVVKIDFKSKAVKIPETAIFKLDRTE